MTTILTKYLAPTAARPARILADAGMKRRLTISYHNAGPAPHRAAAMALCEKFDWHGTLVEGGRENGFAYVFYEKEACFEV